MSRRAFMAGLAAALAVAGVSAEARMHAPYRAHRIIPADAAPPFDAFAQPGGAYSFRRLLSAYAGPGVMIRRASDNAQININYLGFVPGIGAPIDTAAMTSHCAATTCFVVTWYDQSGNARHLTNGTAANQPQLIFNCNGTLPCLRTTVNTQNLSSIANVTPATGVASFSVVANRSTGTTGFCTWLRQNGINNRISSNNVLNQWAVVGGGGGSVLPAAADAAWHSVQAVINGASSNMMVDGVNTTGTVTGNTVAGTAQINGGASVSCDYAEAVVWDNYVLTAGEQAALDQNQRNYWAPAPLDSFTTPSGAYSFRKLKSTYSGPAIRIRRASDNLETDINFLGCTGFTGCPWDSAAANAHCNATTCFVRTWYDQSGAARDLPQASAAAQPSLVFNCIGANPCVRHPSGSMFLLTGGSITPATGILSISAVAQRSGGVGSCLFFRENGATGNRLIGGAANAWTLTSNTTPINATAVDGSFHAAQGVINGASSVLGIDGVETAGTVSPANVTAGSAGTSGAASATCDDSELVLWDNYPLTAGERAALTANQKSFWGTP